MFKTLKVFKNIKFTKSVKRGGIKTVVLKLSGLFRILSNTWFKEKKV